MKFKPTGKLPGPVPHWRPSPPPREVPRPVPLRIPSPARFAIAFARWIAAGRPVRTAEQIAAIKPVCLACPHWDPEKFLGTGGCKLCGCSRLKWEWATTSCPDGLW